MAETQKEFGKLRAFLWPIHNFELKKLIPMLMLCFLILFNYTILRDTKDTLCVTASGAEIIPFLKFWGVLPCAVLFMIIYSKASNILSKPKLFYSTMAPFLVFFALFATVLYPNREILHPTDLADKLEAVLPGGFRGLVAIIRNWTFSLFYIMSELWGSMALSLLFWGFANDITRVSEAKRFYNLFGMGGNFSLMVSGAVIVWCSQIRAGLPAGVDPWQMSLNYMMTLVAISIVLIMGIYWWMNKYVLSDPRFYDSGEQKKMKKTKPKMSITESFKYLMRSKYIGCIAVLVMSYGIAINIIEVTWKSQLHEMYPNYNAYSTFMGKFSFFTGVTTIFMMLFVGGNVIRRLGWTVGALVTPAVVLITGTLFFTFVIFRGNLTHAIAAMGTTPLFLAVIFGAIQNISAKSSKYAMFDPTKEMSYIPLDQEQKIKGKAAVDVVGARLGKSGGALIQQFLILIFGSISVITPYVAGILFIIIGAWMLAAKALGKQFNVAIKKKEEEEAREMAEEPEEAKTPRAAAEAPQNA
ncbi:MAG: NTP/NDP exchange transporter [Simkaniaceae bacterium]|nr:NTP/NDP exchange transporter [Simkaniaceae bacterium]